MNKFFHEIKEALLGHGHDCTCDDCMEEHHTHSGFDRVMVWRLFAAALFFIAGLVTQRLFSVASTILFAISMLCAGYDVLIGAVSNIFRKRLFDESLLMSIVAIAAVIIGEAEEGASVMILFQLGELLQGYAVARVRANIERLMENRSEDTNRVLADVRSDKGEKGRTEEFITKFSRVYTPVVVGIAVLVAILVPLAFHGTVFDGVYKALVIMVIACPCALVISVPLSYFAGIGSATRHGILFKNTGAMDAVSRTTSVVFDKAGALESDRLMVIALKSDKIGADVMLRIAAHACAYSGGHYAEAIKAAYQGVIYIELIQSFEEEEGRGICVEVDGVKITLGLLEFVRERGINPGDDIINDMTAYLAIDGKYTGRMTFGRCAKPDVSGAITVLSWDREVALITDDTPEAAEAFAQQVGIDQYYATCSDKVAIVKQIRKQKTNGTLLFVGNADSDSEAIKAADIGVSLRGADSDAAIQIADVVIMDDSPSKIVTAIEAAKHTNRIVWQNIFFALVFKVIILALDVFGACPLWLAVFADVGVTLLAVLNSLRALRIREPVLPERENPSHPQ